MGRYDDRNLNITLTNHSQVAMREGGGFIADRLMPVVKVGTSSFRYYKWNNAEGITDDYDTLKAPKTEANEINRSYTSATGSCQAHALRELVSDKEMRDADAAQIRPKEDATRLLTRKLRLAIERRIVAKVFSATVMTQNGAASTNWNAESGVDIEGDVDTAKASVRKQAGVEPNTIIIPPHIAAVAKKDSAIRDLVKYTNSTLLVNGELPPVLFGLEVLIPMPLFNEAEPGAAAASKDFLYDDNSVVVAFVERVVPDKQAISLGYQYRVPVLGSMDIVTKEYRDEGKEGDYIECEIEQTEEVTSALCGFLITGAYS